ncbi:hypothetical protein DPMN_118267 [Dreissena polymorpha]|uniref:Uncharacterized protein n=1 Tax=Dreissena polymorpha TaxID=45954 RepID=A0A9D4GJS1_DREPO|nr:hypothetical protein DPMN_118267 [Dreissena polymorpha]
MKENIDLLVRSRNSLRNCFNSKYLFATKSASSHIRGTDVLRSIAIDYGAEHPERLRTTKLRKHIVTMTLSENELDILAKFLGHDIRVHREFYRLPDGTMQVAKFSKLLMMMESGQITRNSVNSLDDIDVDDECI